MSGGVISASGIPSADAASLAAILRVILQCSVDTAGALGVQCAEAIAELPEDSQPGTYDGLVDVARFCVEEEPGWDALDSAGLVGTYPHVYVDGKSAGKRLAQRYEQYEKRFPGLRYVAPGEGRSAALVADEIDSVLKRTVSKETYDAESSEWKTELERNLDALWDLSLDRAVALEEGTLGAGAMNEEEAPEDDAAAAPSAEPAAAASTAEAAPTPEAARSGAALGTQATPTDASPATPSAPAAAPEGQPKPSADHAAATKEASSGAPSSAPPPPADDETQPFLSLASFRALAVTSPVLQKFFEHDLASSVRLEPVQRSTTGGAFAWHAAPVLPRGGAAQNKAGDSNTVSLTTTLIHGNTAPLDADTPASYSRDITTGTRGKVVGFLGGLLGEEGKTRMDALADQVALRLQTHSVKGPLPSFAAPAPLTPEKPKGGLWGTSFMRASSASHGATPKDDARPTLGGRLAGALRRQPPKTETTTIPHGDDLSPTGPPESSILSREGPEAAVASLRAANEALTQERDTFIIDEVQPSTLHEDADEDDHDAMSDVDVDMEVIRDQEVEKGRLEGETMNGQLQGLEAQRAQGMYDMRIFRLALGQ